MKYIIPGDPIAWKRAGVNFNKKRIYDAQKNTKLLMGIILSKQHKQKPLTGPLKVTMIFYIKTAKNKQPGDYVTEPPDWDNYCKLMDAANGILWKDDCIIADGRGIKIYDDNPRTEITVEELKGTRWA